jgi:hypothetical protein
VYTEFPGVFCARRMLPCGHGFHDACVKVRPREAPPRRKVSIMPNSIAPQDRVPAQPSHMMCDSPPSVPCLFCLQPWLLDKSDTCPLCKRPAFRHVSSLRYGDEQSMEPLASAASDQASGFVDFPLHPISLEALALDDIGNFLQQNSCLFALLLVAVVSSATVLGLAAIIKG